MKRSFQTLRDWFWDKLFLDFYLDKRWTFRFKVLNFLSGDVLRMYLCSVWYHCKELRGIDPRDIEEFEQASAGNLFHCHRLKYRTDELLEWFSRGGS